MDPDKAQNPAETVSRQGSVHRPASGYNGTGEIRGPERVALLEVLERGAVFLELLLLLLLSNRLMQLPLCLILFPVLSDLLRIVSARWVQLALLLLFWALLLLSGKLLLLLITIRVDRESQQALR